MGLRKLFNVVSLIRHLTESSPSMPLRIFGATLTALLLAACASPTVKTPSAGHLRPESAIATAGSIPQPVQQSLSLPRPKPPARLRPTALSSTTSRSMTCSSPWPVMQNSTSTSTLALPVTSRSMRLTRRYRSCLAASPNRSTCASNLKARILP